LGVSITSGITANNKPYDGTSVATISVEQRGIERGAGRRHGERAVIHEWLCGELFQYNAGTGNWSDGQRPGLTGTAAGNYTLDAAVGLTANIGALGVSITLGYHGEQQAV